MAFSDKYIGGARLRAGAFGEVRRARCRATGRELAVKTLLAGEARKPMAWPLRILQKPRSRSCLIEREAEVWSHVGQHPNLVRLVDVCPFASGVHLVMERCGASLDCSMEAVRARGLVAVRRLARELLTALEHVHSSSVIHRDVKPANLLLTDDDARTLKLCDFGSAVLVPDSGSFSVYFGGGGSPNYWPPETVRTCVFTTKADVWAAGATLYELLYGSHPYVCLRNLESGRVQPKYNPTPDCRGGAWLRGDASRQSVELVRSLLQRDPHMRSDAASALRFDFMAKEAVGASGLALAEDDPLGPSPSTRGDVPASAPTSRGGRPRGLLCCATSTRTGPPAASPRPSVDGKGASASDADTQPPASTCYWDSTEGSGSVLRHESSNVICVDHSRSIGHQ